MEMKFVYQNKTNFNQKQKQHNTKRHNLEPYLIPHISEFIILWNLSSFRSWFGIPQRWPAGKYLTEGLRTVTAACKNPDEGKLDKIWPRHGGVINFSICIFISLELVKFQLLAAYNFLLLINLELGDLELLIITYI